MNVLLTGAAGLVGGALAHELTRRGHAVLAMVHREPEVRGNDGGLLPSLPFDGSPPPCGEIRRIQADVTAPALGLSEAALVSVRSLVECVVHCAAMVQFNADLDDLVAVNVAGTLNMAAQFPKARFIHVSTAYTCGLREGSIPEALHPAHGEFSNGYERSKALAESELLRLRPDAVLARPSIVIGEYESGRIRSFDKIYRAFKFIAEGRIDTVPHTPGASLNFVPIDHVVDGLASLVAASEASPPITHLAARKSMPVERFLHLVGKTPGLKRPRLMAIGKGAPHRSCLAQRLIEPYWPYFTRSPDFETAAFTRLTGRPSPEIDDAAMLRQIGYCVESGFIGVRERP